MRGRTAARTAALAAATVLVAAGGPGTALVAQELPSVEALRPGLLLQVVVDPSVDGDDPDPARVSMAAARLRLEGRLEGGFDYLLQTDFARSPSLLDARVGWGAGTALGVSAGRFKAPFSRELLTYAGSIDFVNRARVVEALAPGRQLGGTLHGQRGGVRWDAGAFTGREAAEGAPLAGVGRVEVRPSWAAPAEGLAAFAVSAAVGRHGAVAGTALGDDFRGDGVLLGADGRWERGALLLAAEVIAARWDEEARGEEDAGGLYLTAGWMAAPRTQLLVRWDRWRAPGAATDDALLAGLNVWPTEATEIQVNWWAPVGGGTTPHKLLVNLQVGF